MYPSLLVATPQNLGLLRSLFLSLSPPHLHPHPCSSILLISDRNEPCWAGQMARWVKYSSCKCEGLSLNPSVLQDAKNTGHSDRYIRGQRKGGKKKGPEKLTVESVGPEYTHLSSMPLPSILTWAASVSQAQCCSMGVLTVTASGGASRRPLHRWTCVAEYQLTQNYKAAQGQD